VEIPSDGTTTAIVYPAEAAVSRATLILAHGAGAGQRSPFMVAFARAIAALGIDVVTFDFLYAHQRRRVPDRTPVLEACYEAAIEAVSRRAAGERLFIGGKSMGGRIATHVAATGLGSRTAGVVLLGYPLHPPGRPEQRRDAHLPSVRPPMLFVQGSRDTFGTPEELGPVVRMLGSRATLHVVDGGDHSFKLPRGNAARQAAVYEDIQRTVAEWIVTHTSAPAPRHSA
jgi:uncharacterized protein